ncbi:glycoside hydrolase superfamily [Lipomyces japonicus]|uniref:glycoside hydrolase superfamily n=1 Tax=Lipomyces japonicus TaxID=56871 RepID=UPI0034CFD0D3
MKKHFCLLLAGWLASLASAFDASANSNLVLYWGQNSYGQVGSQQDLSYYCQDSTTDIIVLAFLNIFYDSSYGLPEINFAGSCEGSYFSNTNLLQCTSIGQDIQTCQANGKKVFLSLGGASGSYGFSSDSEAQEFATTIWNLFGGGNSDTRPFGDAVVDGFDLDIEGGSSTGYAAFVTALRAYYADYTAKQLYISGAPQCPIPDSFLNDALVNSNFDFAFVQFFNNYCGADQWVADSDSNFNFDSWDSFAKTSSFNTDLKIYLGVPASQSAAGTGYVSIDTLTDIAAELFSTYSSFGGIMMWYVIFCKS